MVAVVRHQAMPVLLANGWFTLTVGRASASHGVRMRRFPRRAQGGRVSARPLECRQEAAAERFRGAEPSEAQLHEGAGEPAVDTCCPCPCGTRAAFAATYVAALPAQTECLPSRTRTEV